MLGNDTAFTLKASYDRKSGIKMFLDNLSASVLRLCDTHKLSYEAASERCGLSSRYLGDIARGKTAPTILTLEKLCVGFDLTPNDLLVPSPIGREMSFRITGLPDCPHCGRNMGEYQPCCSRCGQCVSLNGSYKATILLSQK